MKAKIKTESKRVILAANLSDERLELLKTAADAHGAQLTVVDDAERSICSLLGDPSGCDDKAGSYPVTKDECLLFAGFDRGALNETLDTLRAVGLEIPLKAMYTPNNRRWSFAHLINELKKEHRYMNGGFKK